jgi:hypothetical protein
MLELNNSYLAMEDSYPTSLEVTLQLLSHYQDHKIGDQFGGDNNIEGTSCAQKEKCKLSKVGCYECNEFGHYKWDCLLLNHQLMQNSNSDSEEKDLH